MTEAATSGAAEVVVPVKLEVDQGRQVTEAMVCTAQSPDRQLGGLVVVVVALTTLTLPEALVVMAAAAMAVSGTQALVLAPQTKEVVAGALAKQLAVLVARASSYLAFQQAPACPLPQG